MNILEIKMKCSKCGKEFMFKDVEIVEADYNVYSIHIADMKEECFDGNHLCGRKLV